MSWYCPRWTRNLTGEYANYQFGDGDDCDTIYSEARCTNFDQRGWFTIDEQGDTLDSGRDDDSDATCGEHDVTATWDADYTTIDDLRNAGFYVCSVCEETYHDYPAGDMHYLEEHGDNEDARPYAEVRTSHSGWVS